MVEADPQHVILVPELQGGDDVAAFAQELTTALANGNINLEQYYAAKEIALNQPALQVQNSTAPSLFAEALVANPDAMALYG